MTTDRELQLALRVIELLDLRDKLLEQNKSYQNLAFGEKKLEDNTIGDLTEKLVRKHKTVGNIMTFVSNGRLTQEMAQEFLHEALTRDRIWSQSQILKERDNRLEARKEQLR